MACSSCSSEKSTVKNVVLGHVRVRTALHTYCSFKKSGPRMHYHNIRVIYKKLILLELLINHFERYSLKLQLLLKYAEIRILFVTVSVVNYALFQKNIKPLICCNIKHLAYYILSKLRPGS